MNDLFVSPAGNDRWSGGRAAPNRARTDGPLATIGRARDLIRSWRREANVSGPVTVHLRGGRYPIAAPLRFTPEDSYPVTYAAYRGETPVLDGGEPVGGFRVEQIHGRRAWVADLPDVAAGRWYFRDLYVNGERRPRPQLPKTGHYRIAGVPDVDLSHAQLFDGSRTFTAAPGDVKEFRNLGDVEALIHHFWVEERMPIQTFRPEDNLVTSSRRSIFVLKKGHGSELAEYRLDNVFEALTEPGEWYLDRVAGRLYYLPRAGETIARTRVVAPRATQFLVLEGQPEQNAYVEFLRFRGLRFEHSDWRQPTGGMPDQDLGRVASGVELGSDAQSALTVVGAISMRGARSCAVEDCVLTHLGSYAIDLGPGATGNRIVGNTMADLGGGGVKLHGGNAASPACLRTGNNRVTDNHIHHIGEVFKPACGIISAHAFGNVIAHNHIHHTHYSGISVGWVWGYSDSVSKDNRVEFNHIHHIGRGLLSDMGGIYTLGVQPGTVLRNNLIHDVRTCQYGGWAIYPDEGSSHLIIENNVCYNTDSTVFHTHYGRELIVRNNVFAFGREGTIALGRCDDHNSFTLHRNILITAGEPLHFPGYGCQMESARYYSDHNWIMDMGGRPPLGAKKNARRYSLRQLRALGLERRSRVGDPGLRDPKHPERGLKANAIAIREGFVPIDLSTVGVRPAGRRE